MSPFSLAEVIGPALFFALSPTRRHSLAGFSGSSHESAAGNRRLFGSFQTAE
jgi:hypothetical protein